MAGPKGSKYFDIFLDYQVWLTTRSNQGKLSDNLVSLLKLIEKHGSLKSAAGIQGLSYRKAWGDLRKAEDFLGFRLIETVRGGKDGGLSRLTEDGRGLIEAFTELHKQFDEAIYNITKRFFRQLNEQEESET
ncbi:MAG: LysR family transcriptional regulator [Bacteroidetes bacterium]|jgi:molybdate transport system regulatory protein|nr:LysR family transcriptional regulator [Bacteroidota bacterium]MBT3751525.1 LysR family transcriptional regulator [Bacteroidota bacterium]MBT4398343.1 LysR family transcriptional regulator [Bacteroidota bacterium]MBT4409942.1 LysR family transcriptional regulator [Bacteroidota bacterium]MBT5424840.1 LysR family transcriptional regulator [Bacteroidota bacterium]